MPINQNHLFEDLDGIKCAIVEKNASKERVDFLKRILEFNQFAVVVVPSPPPKAPTAPVAAATPDDQPATLEVPPAEETFTIGVTDVMFNPINAIFGRLLKAPDGHIITLAYWNQKEKEPHDDIPYFDNI